LKRGVITFGFVVAAGFIIGFVLSTPRESEPEVAEPTPVVPREMTVESFLSEFEENERAAHVRYIGKPVQLLGVLSARGKERDGSDYLIVSEGNGTRHIKCLPVPGTQPDTSLKEGDEVLLEGFFEGKKEALVIGFCTVTRREEPAK
jgi:hypothetical protein